ncbi:MotA/TolQ/ExbB proton channel family protein [Lachnospiraceae bacterium 45-P1]
MDLTTLIGIVLGFVLIVNGIKLENIGNFVDMPSVLIVIGGTLAGIIASYPLSILLDIPKHFLILFRGKKYNIPALVEQMVDLAMVARQNGLLALEEKAEEIKDPFFKQSVLMIVDANDPEKVRYVLERELENMMVRHDEAAGLYEKGSAYAPAFGMVGTLVGLINMLKGLNLDGGAGGASNLGQDMSVALITTFYGSVLSNLIFHPIAKKLRIRNDEEELYCSTIIEGIIAIQAGENPKYLREHLLASTKQSVQRKLLAKADKAPSSEAGEK